MARLSESGVPIEPVYGPEDLAGWDPAAQLGQPGAQHRLPQERRRGRHELLVGAVEEHVMLEPGAQAAAAARIPETIHHPPLRRIGKPIHQGSPSRPA